MSLSWSQALAWRMRQQLLDPIGTESVEGVVRCLGAVPAQPEAGAELAVRVRSERTRSGEVTRALADGRIIKTLAFRGATHLMTPETVARTLPCGQPAGCGSSRVGRATTT